MTQITNRPTTDRSWTWSQQTGLFAAFAVIGGVMVAIATAKNGGGIGLGLCLLAGVLGGYFLPTIVAAGRHHHNVGSVAVVNIFLGWTLIGWVIALAMAASAVREAR